MIRDGHTSVVVVVRTEEPKRATRGENRSNPNPDQMVRSSSCLSSSQHAHSSCAANTHSGGELLVLLASKTLGEYIGDLFACRDILGLDLAGFNLLS